MPNGACVCVLSCFGELSLDTLYEIDLQSPSYRDRFWRPSVFEGLRLVRAALDKSYGTDQVSLVSAAFRWLNHHSLMTPDSGGQLDKCANLNKNTLHTLTLLVCFLPPSCSNSQTYHLPSFCRCHNHWSQSIGTCGNQPGSL